MENFNWRQSLIDVKLLVLTWFEFNTCCISCIILFKYGVDGENQISIGFMRTSGF